MSALRLNFFRAVLGLQQHGEKGTEISHTPLPSHRHCLPHYQQRPPECTFVTIHERTMTHHNHQSPCLTLRLILGVVPSTDLDKCVLTRMHVSGLKQYSHRAANPLCSTCACRPASQSLATAGLSAVSTACFPHDVMSL